MAGNFYIAPPERTGFGDFVDALKPGLEQAFQMYLQNKMQRQQEQDMLKRYGIGKEEITPQGQDYAFKQMGITDPFSAEQVAQAQQGVIPKVNIPEKFKRYTFDIEKAKQLPPGMEIPLGYGASYKVPSATSPTVGIYTLDEEGKPKLTGSAPKGSRVFSPSQMETPIEKQEREVETTKLKKTEEIRAESQAVDNMAETVWQAADNLIPAPEEPSEAELLGISRRLKTAAIGGWRPQRMMGISDENALAFDQVKRGEATPLIRALGEKGMLTNQDIERAYNLMPHFSDTQKLRNIKKEELKKFLKSRVNAYNNQSQQPTEQTTQPQEDMSKMSDEELRRIASGG